MAEPRSIVTAVSVVVALVCASWAIYAVKHQEAPTAFQGAGPGAPGGPAGGAPGAPRMQPATQVITAAAEQRRISIGLQAIGTAVANESVSVTSKGTNIVTAIRFQDGQTVQAGQVLVELDRGTAAADVDEANAAYEESRSQWNRARELLATQVVSRSEHEQLESTMKSNEARVAAAKARLSDTYIRAPFSGRVGLRRVSLGALISPGTIITTLDDISSIKVDFAVPEANVGSLRAGQIVRARTTAYAGRDFAGSVSSVDSRVDPATRSVLVRASVPNRDGALKPGMFLTVDLSQDQRPALMIPEEALVPEQARQFVYAIEGNVARKVEVTLGRREPGSVEITSGLNAGARVVVEGTIKLRDGAEVREVSAEPAVSSTSPAVPAPVSPASAAAGRQPT